MLVTMTAKPAPALSHSMAARTASPMLRTEVAGWQREPGRRRAGGRSAGRQGRRRWRCRAHTP
eukprot:14170386-Alexandrium_andersonii.AAC.1